MDVRVGAPARSFTCFASSASFRFASSSFSHEAIASFTADAAISCIYDGRLYLLEAQEYEQRRDSTEVKKAKKNTALRICVLTLDGELCQEYSVMDARNSFPRNWLRGRLNDMNFVADKLVLSCEWARSLLSLRLA